MPNVRGLSIFIVCTLILLCALSSSAQKISGDISGDVTDKSGGVIAGATVTVENTGTGFTRTTTTNASGNFRIPELPIGTYRVSVSAQGFKTTVSNVVVSAAAVTEATYALEVGQRAETVMVEGSAPLVELSSNNNNYVDAEKIVEVPLNGRDFNSLLAITPGVQRAPGGGFLAVSINGSRTTSNNYLIDGLYNNDRYYGDSAINQTGVVGIPATLFPPEAIQELGVQETPSAEFGVKGGAPINLVMKSGTNAWHGDARWVRHTDAFDAANFFADGTGPTPLRNMQFGGTLGGPIIKDKTFFFVYYEGQRYASFATKRFNVPNQADVTAARDAIAAAGLTTSPIGETLLSYFPISPSVTPGDNTLPFNTPTTATMDTFGFKIDQKITNNIQLSGRYIFGDSLQSAPSGSVPAAGQPDLFNSVAPSRAQMAGLSLTWNFGPNKILESRLGWTRFSQIIRVNNKIDPKSLGIDTGPLEPTDFGVPYTYLYGFSTYIGGVQGYPITTAPDQTKDWSEHFTWIKGNHTMKIGGNFQDAYTNSLRNRARSGFLEFGYAPSATCGAYDIPQNCDVIEELLLGKADAASRNFGDTHRHIYSKSVGFYFSDDWKINNRLTLTLGIRYDIAGALEEDHNLGSNFFPGQGLVQLGQGISRLYDLDKNNWGPRAGFAWDVFGRGKLAIRGGYSLTYDLPNFAAIAAPYTFAGSARAGAFTQPNLGAAASFSVGLTGDVGNGVTANDPESGSCFDPASQVGDYICLGGGPIYGTSPNGTPPFNIFSIVKNFQTPMAHNYNLSVQYELAKDNVFTIGYSGQLGRDLALYRDLNASPLGSAGAFADRPFSTQFPDYNHIIQLNNDGQSHYDSLQMSYNQRNFHGFNNQANFTWSKCFDYNSVNRGGAGDYPQLNNPYNAKDSYGLCDHDVRFNFNVGAVYTLPHIAALGKYLNGWQVSGIMTAISGRPFTALLGGSDPSGQGMRGSSIRAAWDGTKIKYNTRDPDNYVQETYTTDTQLDPCGRDGGGLPLSPFYRPCDGTVGNSQRNQLIGPGLAQLDMSVIKNTRITEKLAVQFRWEVYNVLNRGNFYYFPNNIVDTSQTFGQVKETSDVAAGNPVVAQGGPRNMNFALKFVF
jgi:hypothetical protein